MSTFTPDVSAVLDDLTATLPRVLGGNLVGMYLYGSLTQDAFDPRRSDIDCIAVIHREVTDDEFRRLELQLGRAAAGNPWFARLQLSFLIRDTILVEAPRGNCLFQFGRLSRVGSDGNPIFWVNVLESGVTLFGPPAETFVPRITRELLDVALLREVGYLSEEIREKPAGEWRDDPAYRAYAVLTLCRILYTHAHGAVVSKPRAAEWALESLPTEWHEIIVHARAADAGSAGSVLDLPRIASFIEFSLARLESRR